MKKCKGGCQMKSGGKTCSKCGCDMEDEEYEKEEKEMKSGGMACMKCGGKMHKSGGTVSSCMKCGGGKYTFGGKVKWAKKYANGGLVYDDTEPPYDAPDTKVASGDGRLKRKKLSYAEKQYYSGLKNRNLDPTEANNMLRSAGYPTIYDIKNETTPMEPGMKMTQYDVYGDPNNALRPMYKNIMTDTSPNVLPGFKMFLGMINKPTPTSFGETFQEALSENNYLNAIKNLDEIKSKNTVTQNTNNVTPTQSTFLPFYFGKDRYDTGGHMTKGLDNIFYGLNEQKFYPTGLENRPVNQNWLSYKNRNTYSDKSASMSGASYMFGGKVNWAKKKINNNQDTYASGGMIKRADGSYSQRGLWDNIRANAGSGKKPTKQMLEQEKKIKQNMSFGGTIKSYNGGGEVARTGNRNTDIALTLMDMFKVMKADNEKYTGTTSDKEIQIGKGTFNVSEPPYDANKIMSRVFDNALSIKESEQPTTKQTGYKEEVEKNKVVKDDKSLPNWGRAKKEQQILNELIRKDIAAGKSNMDLLVEDDIIGDYTLGAMRAYEASGQYTRPELFKDKWLAEYKKQWDEMQKSKSSAGNQESKTESSWGEKMFGFKKSELVDQPEIKNNTNAESSSQFGWTDKYLPKIYKDNNKPGWGVLAPESQKQNTTKSLGWSKEQLLKEGGIEIDSKELFPKDFDTYFPIKGFSKSKKGVRATGRDRSDAYFDAVEKSQYFDLNGLKANTSINLINELLTKSKKVIIIPKGQDKYGRDLNDIYLQDENDPSKYHALDSLGVVNREAIFGEYIGEESKMTERQKMITGQAKEKGGFKYSMSPYIFRKLNSQESPKQTTTKSKEEPLFPLFEELYKIPKEDVKSKSKSTSVPKSTEKTTLFPSFSKIMNSMNSATTNNTERDNQFEQLARDIEADYETEQNQSYRNFGKKSSAAAAKSVEERSKSNKGYAPISVNLSMPTLNNENTQVKKESSDYVKNAKGQLIATDFNNQQKEKKVEERVKRINEAAENYIKLNLKKPNNREDIKYNINAINEYNSKIEEALSMLSGTTDDSRQGFNRMTAIESIRYNPETKKKGSHFEHVNDEEYDRLTVVHTFLENELDKIYKDPRYKNESAFNKKRILQRKLHETQKKMGQMQYEMKKQINDFN